MTIKEFNEQLKEMIKKVYYTEGVRIKQIEINMLCNRPVGQEKPTIMDIELREIMKD